jgi:uncharacterized membrane protein
MKHLTATFAAALLASCTQSGSPEAPAHEQSNAAPQLPIAPRAPLAPSVPPKPDLAGACLTQDGEKLQVQAVKAIGTEPFWGARTEGRCVTYSTPEDQKGTRIWTHVDTGPQGPVWNGALRGRQFQLYVKTSTGCSDGMSDRTWPLDAVLRVDGETRRGCAEPL